MKNKIILIGIPNNGKTTLGKRVSEKLNLPFYDTDRMTMDKVSIENPAAFFRLAFNGGFIAMQCEFMRELAQSEEAAIIATGAEVALIPECALLMKSMGTIVHVKRDSATVIDDIKNGEPPRLVLMNVTTGEQINTHERSVELYSEEFERYEALADVELDNNGSENEGVEKLTELVNEFLAAV